MNDMTMVAAPAAGQMAVQMGFGSVAGFELLTRIARAISQSSLVPTSFQSTVIKYDKNGNVKSSVENPQGLPNCMVALNMAHRLGDDPLMVMQNLDVIEGRPSWSAKWIIAKINASGRFHPLRFDLVERGQRTITMTYFEWEGGQRYERTRDVVVNDQVMICWTLPISEPAPPRTLAQALAAELAVLKSAPVSIEMAVKEGWYTKAGSKWQTMPDLMLHYRSAAFFGRIYAPDLLLGLITSEEARDIIASRQVDGSFAVDEDGVVAGAVPTTAAERARAALKPEPASAEPAKPVEAKAETAPAPDDLGMAWWNATSEADRARWMKVAGSAVPADAWAAFQRETAKPAAAPAAAESKGSPPPPPKPPKRAQAVVADDPPPADGAGEDAITFTYAQVADKIARADAPDVLDLALDLITSVRPISQHNELAELGRKRAAELQAGSR